MFTVSDKEVLKLKKQLAQQILEETQKKIIQLGLEDTGELRKNYKVEIDGDKVFIVNDLEYSLYIEYGTTAHFVKPKEKTALHWVVEGKDYFSRGHMVKGIPPYAPVRNAILTLTS